MRQSHRNRRLPGWAAAAPVLAAALVLASCGGSSKTTASNGGQAANGAPSATSTSSTSGSGGSTAPSGPTGSNGNGTGGSSASPSSSPPVVRATSFVTCMRAHGVKLPKPARSKSGATLDFKAINTHDARYKAGVAACASKLLGNSRVKVPKGKTIHVTGIHIRGIHVGSIHLGNIKIGSVNVPPIHITTPPVNGAGAGAAGGEPPTGASKEAPGETGSESESK